MSSRVRSSASERLTEPSRSASRRPPCLHGASAAADSLDDLPQRRAHDHLVHAPPRPRRAGRRALRWPFSSGDVHRISDAYRGPGCASMVRMSPVDRSGGRQRGQSAGRCGSPDSLELRHADVATGAVAGRTVREGLLTGSPTGWRAGADERLTAARALGNFCHGTSALRRRTRDSNRDGRRDRPETSPRGGLAPGCGRVFTAAST